GCTGTSRTIPATSLLTLAWSGDMSVPERSTWRSTEMRCGRVTSTAIAWRCRSGRRDWPDVVSQAPSASAHSASAAALRVAADSLTLSLGAARRSSISYPLVGSGPALTVLEGLWRGDRGLVAARRRVTNVG